MSKEIAEPEEIRRNFLPIPRINLSEIIEVFQTVVIAEQARERLNRIKGLAENPTRA